MAIATLAYTFTVGAVIIAAQHNTNFSNIYSEFNGNIEDVNISASAAIDYSKLNLVGEIRQTDLVSTFNTSSGFGMVPTGGIIMWSGTVANIPTGWYLCNGSNGTPDLRDKFIVGAKQDDGGVAKTNITGSLTQAGGSTTIDITQIPAHTHDVTFLDGYATGHEVITGRNNVGSSYTQATASAGGGTAYTQPYYALCYIFKS